jgi:hypothetical protein
MRYLLVVGFVCNVYKKEPRARIFVNDRMIDEYYIPNHHDDWLDNFIQQQHVLQPNVENEFENLYIKNLPPLKFYELEINEKQENIDFIIEIDNDDNNYNNGFMTKSTLIQLRIFYFFPLNLKLLSKLEKIYNKNKLSKNLAWFYSGKFNLFDNNLKNVEWHWHKNNKDILNNGRGDSISMSHYQVGGSGFFIIKRIKKYGILISKLIKSYRFIMNRIDPGVGSYELKNTINFMIDKYTQYANQRNTDQRTSHSRIDVSG